ncbi:fibroleukin-like [Saccostrea cucullata]|uniref:fibroleukin-like n=1 Tax=Saccostrea cuccullata TaxID=36930 RepID=UPI002ED58BEE
MGVLLAICLIFVFLAVSRSTIISRKYIRKPEFDDKKSSNEFLEEYNSASFIKCATLCQTECFFYGFNPRIKKCRTHKMIFTSGIYNENDWRYYSFDFIPRDCEDLYSDGNTNSGVYDIYPYGTITSPVRVYCDMNIVGGGWTAIQKRVTGSQSFDKDWAAYKIGFGAPEQDFWVGNDVIHLLTKEKNTSLYISITLQNGTKLYEIYDRFSVSDETENYKLYLARPATGTLGDRMLDTGIPQYDLSEMYFTTRDRDNDKYSYGNCAVDWQGGWWFNFCHHAYLTGPWSSPGWLYPWNPAVESGESVRGTLMLIKSLQVKTSFRGLGQSELIGCFVNLTINI